MTIRKLLVSAAILATMTGGAWAADLPNTKGPPMYAPPPPQFTWTGLYVGAQAGYEWGTTSAYLETYPGDVFLVPPSVFPRAGSWAAAISATISSSANSSLASRVTSKEPAPMPLL